jgi:diguanylate cyclase (GGDEF)-like protein
VVVDPAKQVEMLGATLELLEEGVAVLDPNSIVIYWNDAAAALTGYRPMDILSRRVPVGLYEVHEHHKSCGCPEPPHHHVERYTGPAYSGLIYTQKSLADVMPAGNEPGRPVLVRIRHHLGHELPAMLRKVPLKDALGGNLGTALLFRPTEQIDALPHGENVEDSHIGRSQEEIEERLDEAFHEWTAAHTPFGLLWITVDQAAQMRRTHGRDACEAMLVTVEQRLTHGLRPNEIIGRWGTDEFLVLCHERTPAMLLEHGDHLAGLTRTANFRWWGDLISLTASIGVAQAVEGDTLSRLMLTAQQAMHASVYAGGNRVTHGREQTCLR